MQPMTVHAPDACAPRWVMPAADLDSPACRLLTPYRAIAGVRRSKGVPMNGTNDAERITAFLSSVEHGPAALLIEGEAGIGRTTLWLAAAEEARRVGFRAIAASDGGAAHSAESVRHKIRQMIDAEQGVEGVLSDDRIVEILKGGGVDIARRTVAKYREAMRIPSSVDRRRLLKEVC